MPNQNHPDDERLSALAGHDPEAAADAELVAHLGSCTRCTDLVTELGALRMSLADLPDVVPPRPLRLLPPAGAPTVGPADRVTGWMRRLFAPVMTAGAALAMVGLVGTVAPGLGGAASGPAPAFEQNDAGGDAAMERATADDGAPQALSSTDEPAAEGDSVENSDDATGGFDTIESAVPAERSPWPMVLFSGVALLIGAVLLRWILVPRAG